MEALRSDRVREWLGDKRGMLVDALPTICFYLVLFWVVQIGFGSNYLLAVSPLTSLFSARLGKYNSLSQFARFFLMCGLALALARVAVCGAATSIVVNLLAPFLFIFIRSSQLNPRRYFPYTMLFAFLQLKPQVLIDEFGTQALTLVASCSLLTVSLLAFGIVRRPSEDARERLHRNILRLADDLGKAGRDGIDDELREELLSLRSEFSDHAYTAREDSSAPVHVTNLLDMFATLGQRTAYLVGNFDWSADGEAAHAEAFLDLADITRRMNGVIETSDSRVTETEDSSAIISRARELLGRGGLGEPRFRIFYQSYLNLVILIMRTAQDPGQRVWRMSALDRVRVMLFRKRPSLESFEMRFSVRCGIVLMVTGVVNLLLPIDHLYWLGLHAFLLLQPFREESLRRTRTRMVGTVLGCLFVQALGTLNLGWGGIMLLGMVFIAFIYASTPGSTFGAFFATAYAVSLASTSIDDTYATVMRIVSLVLAAALVTLVNRLVCPTSDQRLFVADVHQMFSMVGRYWDLVRETLTDRVDTVVSSESLLHFQMIHSQACTLLVELHEAPHYHEAAERMLFCTWELMGELEQLELLVRQHEVSSGEMVLFARFIDLAEQHCNPEDFGTGVEEAEAIAFRLAEPDLRYVLQQYIDRAGELRLAIDDARRALVERPSYLTEVTRH